MSAADPARVGCGKGWGEIVGGTARGRGTPPAQLGGMGERCKLPHRGLGLRPRSQRFLRRNPPKSTLKLHQKPDRIIDVIIESDQELSLYACSKRR